MKTTILTLAIIFSAALTLSGITSAQQMDQLLTDLSKKVFTLENSVFRNFSKQLQLTEENRHEISEILDYIREMEKEYPAALSIAKKKLLNDYLNQITVEFDKAGKVPSKETQLKTYGNIRELVRKLVDNVLMEG